uniref:TraX n=1 Tax=Achromobacter denitrificans TaxID=32002 RepID=Q6QHL2_ACHDE|nr:TraX [Achromobacter denitrificans]
MSPLAAKNCGGWP